MDANLYAPPRAAVADVERPLLKRRSVLLMIVIFIATLGIYYPIWFLRRRAALNALDSEKKLQIWPFVAYGVVFVVEFVVSFVSAYSPEAIGREPQLVLSGVRLLIAIVMIVQAFVVKQILEDHLAGPDDEGAPSLLAERVSLSGVLTFFFPVFYLQWAINRHIVALQTGRANPDAGDSVA